MGHRVVKTPRDCALIYARLGWPVLRLTGKVPATAHGVHDATTDHAIVQSWDEWSNIGIRCDRMLVLDVDPRHGGDEEAQQLRGRYGRLDARCVARTGGGGWHALFALPEGVRLRGKVQRPEGGPFRGLDLRRGPGHYIVAAPSVHPDTCERYSWIRWDPVLRPATQWLIDLCTQPEPSDAPIEPATPDEVERARNWLAKVEPAVSGQGGDPATFRVACRLVERGLSDEDAFGLMSEWNRMCDPPWNDSDLRRKIREARRRM
jgi:hypothetical protein